MTLRLGKLAAERVQQRLLVMVSTCLTSSAALQGYFKVYYFHSSIYRTGDPCEFRARSLAGL